MMSQSLAYAKRLIAAASVTPATGAVFDEMEAMLAPLGFAIHRFRRGDGPDGSEEAPVENLFGIRRGPPGSNGGSPGCGSSVPTRGLGSGPI